MKNKVVLQDGTELVGLTNVVISELNGKIFFNNTNQIEDGIKGSLVVYTADGQMLGSSGLDCIWDEEKSTLTIKSFIASDITSSYITSPHVAVEDYLDTSKTVINKWLGFSSKLNKHEHPLKIKTYINPETNLETLCFVTNEYPGTKSKISAALDKDRFYLTNVLNIPARTIETSLGYEGDESGDIAVDENYFYYCIKNYDGISKIWKRCTLSDW